MVQLLIQERHFSVLIVQTTPAQRKALLHTITRQQVRAISQISHNIVKFRIQLTTSQQKKLKCERRLLHILADRKLGYTHKKQTIRDRKRFVYTLLKIAIPYLETILK